MLSRLACSMLVLVLPCLTQRQCARPHLHLCGVLPCSEWLAAKDQRLKLEDKKQSALARNIMHELAWMQANQKGQQVRAAHMLGQLHQQCCHLAPTQTKHSVCGLRHQQSPSTLGPHFSK